MNFVMLYTTHNVLCVSREVNKIAVNVCTSNYSNNTFFCLTRGNILKSATKVMNKKILLSQQPSGIFLKEQNFRLIIKQISMIFRKKTLKTFQLLSSGYLPKILFVWIFGQCSQKFITHFHMCFMFQIQYTYDKLFSC